MNSENPVSMCINIW